MLPRALLPLVVATASCASAAPRELPPLRPDPSAAAEAARGVPDLSGPLRLEALLPLVLGRSPDVLAARARLEAAAERVPQAVALPDPMAEVTWFTRNAMDPDGRVRRYDVMVRQEIPFPTMLVLEGDAATSAMRAEALRYEASVRDVISELKSMQAERAYFSEAARVQSALRDVYARLAEVARSAPGRLTESFRAESLLAQAENELAVIGEMRAVEDQRVRSMLALPRTSPLGEPEVTALPALPDTETLTLRALAWNQELRAAGTEVEMRGTEVRIARTRYAPMFAVGAGRMVNDEFDMETGDTGDSSVVTFGLTLPIQFGAKAAGVREAKANLRAAQAMETAERERVASDVARLAFRARNASRLARLLGSDLVPKAEAAMLRAASAQADGGGEQIAASIELAAAWQEVRLAELRARADLAQSVAGLERILGTSLTDAASEAPR